MPTATVTSKGQVTIPIEVRRHLGISPGTRVDFVARPDGSFEFTASTGSVRDIRGMIGWNGAARSLDDMDDAVQAGAAETLDQ